MTCYSPLHAFKARSNDTQKVAITFSRPSSWRGERLDLPCGQCIGCRLEKSRQWAVRCMHEASLYDRNCFLTLTYNDKFLPKNNSLDKSEFPLFMKRLRKKYGSGIRYYHCGEYGDLYERPHYHALLFNHDFEDKTFFNERNGYKLFTSGSLSELWPKGYSVIGDVTFESAAYVARYVMKKVTGKRAEDHYGNRIPEYCTMSRGSKKIGTGGIGKGWYDKYKNDVYPLDRLIVRGSVTRPPRFYDNLMGREDPSLLAQLKIKREKDSIKFVDDRLPDGSRIKVSDQDGTRLMVKEICKKAEIENLKRPLEGL